MAVNVAQFRTGEGRESNADSDQQDIKDRLSNELVIALIGPVASGVSTTAALLKESFISDFGYEVPEIIKVSDFIASYANKVGKETRSTTLDDRVTNFQNAGNELRKKYGHQYLARHAIRRISEIRHADGYSVKKLEDGGTSTVPVPKRRVYIIDSLKHPEECEILREIYGNIFWLVGVFAPDHIREKRMASMGYLKTRIPEILSRDQGESAEFGQKVRKCFATADYFIRNDTENHDNITLNIERFLDVLFNAQIRSPTVEESAMFNAATAASKSACMSRQVGAALVDRHGELIAVGWNDVPRFGGGLYEESNPGDHIADNRCFKWRDRICHNDFEKKLIENRMIDGLKREIGRKAAAAPLKGNKKSVPITLDDDELRSVIQKSGISALIEFSRAIHAEMAAILAVARDKRHSLRNGTMVVTTYPCHNCARHIVAAGIKEVIYIEPYEKSLAIKLHPDAISEDERDKDHCHFKQFQGFAPRHILTLFNAKHERKRDGKLLTIDKREASPLYRRHLDSFTLYEDKIVHDLSLLE